MNAAPLPQRIQQLLDERQRHADAITAIDETLARISDVLGSGPSTPKAPTMATVATATGKRRRRRGGFTVTGEQSILEFVRQRRNPTTKEINAHWKQEGRGSSADSLLGQLVKKGVLKRKQLGGKLGSEYSLGSSASNSAAAPSAVAATRRGRGYATTAADMILGFVREKKNPTTKEIKELWAEEGRKGKADNELTKLVSLKKLKRTPLVGERGSRYSIP